MKMKFVKLFIKIISKSIRLPKNPSKLNWNLKINDRTQLNYKVDIILARKFYLKFNMQSPGFEPGSLTWQARIITKLYYDCSNV